MIATRRLLVLLLLAIPASARADRVIGIGRVQMRTGDDPAWSSPAYDDRAWRTVELQRVPEAPDVIWLRTTVDLRRVDRLETDPLGLTFSGMASHEIWWDGERIGAGGVVAREKARETPGPVDATYQIPDRLSSRGKHTLAVRLSAFHRHITPVTGIWGIFVGDYGTLRMRAARGAWLSLVALSGIVLTGAFAFALFLTDGRDRRSLLLATLCASAAGLLVAESWRGLFGYSYDLHVVRLVVVTALTWLVSVQLVALVAVRFPLPRRRGVVRGAAIAAAASSLLPMWDLKALVMLAIGVFVSLGWTIAAARRRMPGSVLALVGVSAVAAGLLIDPLRFPDSGLFFLLDVLFVCFLVSHAVDVRREREKKAGAEIKSARLELELLKRQLQPHFLMNTLTALAEWVERDPPTAVRMIEAVADEMRILTDVAGERLIRSEDELRLCRAHLSTMEMRKDTHYHFVALGFDGNELVPPGTFHTLVENAVTHGPRRSRDAIALTARAEGERLRFLFESPAGEESSERTGGGTGTRYIEARLREAWGDRFTFVQSRDGDVWRAEIVVPRETRA